MRTKELFLFSTLLVCFGLGGCQNQSQKIMELEDQLYADYAPNANEAGFPISYQSFLDLLEDYPEISFEYEFKKLTDIEYVKVIDSSDKSMRLYSNNDGSILLIQTKVDNKVYTCRMEDDMSDEQLDNLSDNVTKVVGIASDRGDNIYLLCSNTIMDDWINYNVDAIRLFDGKLQSIPIFEEDNGNFSSSLSFDYLPEPHVSIEYKEDARQLFFPTANDESGVEYEVYTFNGRVFKKEATICRTILHPSVQDYDELIYNFTSDKVNVRIDKMGEGKYRYSSWNAGRSYSDEPNLVLYSRDVSRTDEGDCVEYIFNNDGYTYIMKITYGEEAVLSVKKDGKIIARYRE